MQIIYHHLGKQKEPQKKQMAVDMHILDNGYNPN